MKINFKKYKWEIFIIHAFKKYWGLKKRNSPKKIHFFQKKVLIFDLNSLDINLIEAIAILNNLIFG